MINALENVTEQQDELARRYEANWVEYMEAIAKPWNKFIETGDQINDDAVAADAKNTEAVLRWFSDEVFVNGQPLGELLPIQEAIDQVWANADMEQNHENIVEWKIPEGEPLGLFRAPRTMMDMDRCVEPEGGDAYSWCEREKDMFWKEDAGCWMYAWEPEFRCVDNACGPPCRMTRQDQIHQQLQDSLAEKGWAPGALEDWLEELGTSWEDLMQKQQEEQISKAQADIGAAADKAKSFLDAVLEEAQAIHQEGSEQMGEFQARIDEARAEA